MKKVLIVSYNFPPLNTIASKRYGIMCKYFEQYGYEPYILTTRHDRNYIEWNVRFDLDLPVKEEHIIRLGKSRDNYAVSNKLIRFIIYLLEKGKIASATLDARAFGWYEEVKKSIDLEKIRDVDIIIGTHPEMGNLYVARYLSNQIGCPYIIDIRDLISDYKEVPDCCKNIRWVDRIIEKAILGKARGIVTVTPGFCRILKKRFPKNRFKVVFNGYENSLFNDQGRKARIEGSKDKYLYYAGSLYSHRLESFELLVKCLKKINHESGERVKLVIRSIGPKKLDTEAKKIVKWENMQEYIHILEPVSEEVVRQEQENAYINIILSTLHEDDRALMTTIPGKLYELLNTKVPVLAIAQEKSDIGKVLNYAQKGVASASAESISDFIMNDYKNYEGNENIKYFTRENQARKLCRFMDEVLEVT